MVKYTIYKTTCLVDGKIYIGKHKTDNPNDEYLGSGKYLKRSIEKYGVDKFTKEVLFIFENEQEANEMESKIVDEAFVSRLDTFNLKVGGDGGFDYILNNSLSVGFSHINERLTFDEDFRNFHREKIIQGLRFYYDSIKEDEDIYGEFVERVVKNLGNRFLNKKHTEESKRKIGEANSKHQRGTKNSQYGTCWVCNGEDVKKVKKETLDYWLNLGYYRGRK